MMRFSLPVVMVLAMGACAPKVPDSGAGVGFDNYTDYERSRAEREAVLQGEAVSSQAISNEGSDARQAAEAAVAVTGPARNTSGISDEQDFGAVSGRESIESDRDRLARQREQFTVIEPTALPSRSGSRGPNIVEFALSTTNNVGQSQHRRSKVFAETRFARNCAKFPSPDLAQAEFLSNGGPSKDRKGMDPDGDGFACSWDPAPFRNAKAAAPAPVIPTEIVLVENDG